MKILIAGGGIGGLAAALALRGRGFACEVFEQSAAPGGAGAGIQLSPNAMHVLARLGLAEELAAAAFEPRAAAMRDWRTGKAEMTAPLKGVCEARYGAKYLHIHRGDLLDALYGAARKAGVVLHSGMRVTGYEQGGASVSVCVEGGAAQEGDLLIGADGIHSVVRARMLGDAPAGFTGQIAWRGIVEAKKLPPGLIPPDANAWLGPGRHFVAYYLRRGALINFVAVEERDQWTQESWRVEGGLNDLRRAFAGWDGRIGQLLAACERCFLWGLFDRAPLPRWHEGRAALLGDAAHPMLPFMAQGAAMAIEDGWVLAAQLAQEQSLERALARWREIRFPRASRLQALSRANAGLFHIRSPLRRMARKAAFKLAAAFPQARQARFDAIYRENVTRPEPGQ